MTELADRVDRVRRVDRLDPMGTASTVGTVAAPRTAAALRARLELTAPAVRAVTARLWAPAGLRERYLDYAEAMHGVIRASVPLMAAAARRCRDLARDSAGDPVAAPLAAYLREHQVEERDHDEWLLGDLAAAGRNPADLLARAPGPAIARLVGPQYYWIEHHHPIALLGYIAVLEGNSPPPGLAGRLSARTGLPPEAFRTLQRHAELDTGHRAELDDLLDQLDRLPLRPELEHALHVSALHTVDAFLHLLGRLADPRTECHA